MVSGGSATEQTLRWQAHKHVALLHTIAGIRGKKRLILADGRLFSKQRRHDGNGVLTSFLEKYFPKQRTHDWGGVLTSLLGNYLCIPGFAVVAYLPRLA